jgi:hypothetical protein
MVSIWLMRAARMPRAQFMSRNPGLRPAFDISIQEWIAVSVIARLDRAIQ